MQVKTFDPAKLEGFDWDEGNLNKNRLKHDVEPRECEEVFVNKPLLILLDEEHSIAETRYKVYGVSLKGRKLALALTIRRNKIRVIMARDQSKKERVILGHLSESGGDKNGKA